jgi:hypothetical protein
MNRNLTRVLALILVAVMIFALVATMLVPFV